MSVDLIWNLNLFPNRNKSPQRLTLYISSSYVLLLRLSFLNIKFSCVLETPMRMWRCQHKLHRMTETLLRARQFKESVGSAFSFDVHSKWPLHSASLVLKKVTAPECEVGSCHVPLWYLRQAVFVLKRLKEFKVARFGWHVSWWLGTLIANIRGGCQVGDVIVCTTTCEEMNPRCFDRRALNTSHFLGIWNCVEREQAG